MEPQRTEKERPDPDLILKLSFQGYPLANVLVILIT